MDQKPASRLAAILQNAREGKAKTQEHVADEAGVSVQTVRRAEQTGVVSAESLRAICSALDLDASEVTERAARVVGDVPDLLMLPHSRPDHPPFGWAEGLLFILLMAAPFCLMVPIALIQEAGNGATMPVFIAIFAVFPCLYIIFRSNYIQYDLSSGSEMIAFFGAAIPLWGLVLSAFLYSVAENPVIQYALFVFGLAATMSGYFSFTRPGERARILRLKARDAAVQSERQRLPEVFSAIRNLISKPIGDASVAEIRRLVMDAATICAGVQNAAGAMPLVYLADDVARGVSSRKALQDYLDVAETTCGLAAQSSPRKLRDAWAAVKMLERRVNVFA